MTKRGNLEQIFIEQKDFSIVIPVHNGGEYIKHCINSILNQTVQQFELLILENSSKDGTVEWLSTLKDSRIKIYPSHIFLPIEQNWDRIKNIPRKKWMTILGHDDIMQPNFLETISYLIDQHPTASLYQTHFNYIDEESFVIKNCKPMAEIQSMSEYFKETLENGGGFVMRSSDYDEVGGIPLYANLFFADFALWMKLSHISYKATAVGNCFSYRHHSRNTSSISSVDKFREGLESFLRYLYELRQQDEEFRNTLNIYGINLILLYTKSLSRKLLRQDIKKRNYLTVKELVNKFQAHADQLIDNNTNNISSDNAIKVAAFIDSTAFTRKLFLILKKIYSKPIFKN